MTNTALRVLSPEEMRDEQIIQDVVKGCDLGQVAHAYQVSLEHIQSLFQPPRFVGSSGMVKALELARLDVATRALMPLVEAGDLDAMDRLVKVQARRSKYLGLDVPAQIEQKSQVQIVIRYSNPEFNQPPKFGYNAETGEIDMSADRLSYQRQQPIPEEPDIEDAKPKSRAGWKEPSADAETSIAVRRLVDDAKK